MSWERMLVGLLAAGMLIAGQLPAVEGAAIHGVVRADGKPLAGAVAKLRGPVAKRATTDAKGAFAFTGLTAGTYRLTVSKAGYGREVKKVQLAAGQRTRLVFNLKRLPAPMDKAEAQADAREEMKAPAPARPSKPSARARSAGAPASPPPPAMTSRPMPKRRLAKKSVSSAYVGEPPRVSTEQYVEHGVRQWELAAKDRLSTFSVDVDTASYTIARRKLREGRLPPPAAVRTEEFVNYFRYDYPAPTEAPFNVVMEASPSPFEKKLHVLRIGVKGMEAKGAKRKPVHLTFLVDTSGSMRSADKLGLVKRSLRFLVDQLQAGDTVALCTYAGSVREVLGPTGMQQRAKIHEAIEDLAAGGSTAMASGLQLAYKLAYQNLRAGSVNRVIVCSDGDANVGRTTHGDMLSSITHYAAKGVTLSTLGFGMGNYKDHKMEQLADKGNGNYYYIDTFSQAKRVFGEQLMGTLQVIAKDVKIQVELDPQAVRKYRLIGYENRDIADRDFRNDKVDAGEIGAGHTVTALYELELTDPRGRFATVRVRWKKPQGTRADEKAFVFQPSMMKASFDRASAGFRRAVAAAALAENLRNSPFKESWTIEKARHIAKRALSRESREELELIELIAKAADLMGKK